MRDTFPLLLAALALLSATACGEPPLVPQKTEGKRPPFLERLKAEDMLPKRANLDKPQGAAVPAGVKRRPCPGRPRRSRAS